MGNKKRPNQGDPKASAGQSGTKKPNLSATAEKYEKELLDYMFIDFKGSFVKHLIQLIIDYKMNLTHFSALLNFIAGAFITMVDSPIASRHGFLESYMSDMHIDIPEDYSVGTGLMYAAVTGDSKKPTLKLFYFTDMPPENAGDFYLEATTYKNLAKELKGDFPSLVDRNNNIIPNVDVYIAAMTGPDSIEAEIRSLRKAETGVKSSTTHKFFKLEKGQSNADRLNVDPRKMKFTTDEPIEELFLKKMKSDLVTKYWGDFKLDRHDDATYRFFLGTLNNWANRLRLFVDVWMEDYYSTDHATIRHVTTNFEIYPGRIMERFGVPLVTLVRHRDRKIPDYEGLGAFIRSLGPDAPYQVTTESDVYRFFDLQPKFEEGQEQSDYPNPIDLEATFTNDRKYFPGLADQLFSQRMLDCYPKDQQRLALIEARKALTRGATMENIVAHFLGLLMTESEDGRSFYLILENAYISPQKVHLFLIRGWDPSAIIAISEGRVDYVRLINILVEHCTEFKLPLQFTLTTIDKGTNNLRKTDFQAAIGNQFTVSTANEWFDWSSRPVFSKFMNVDDGKKKIDFVKTNLRPKAAGSVSDLNTLFVDTYYQKNVIAALKESDDSVKQGKSDVFDRNAYTDDLIAEDSYYGSQYSLYSQPDQHEPGRDQSPESSQLVLPQAVIDKVNKLQSESFQSQQQTQPRPPQVVVDQPIEETMNHLQISTDRASSPSLDFNKLTQFPLGKPLAQSTPENPESDVSSSNLFDKSGINSGASTPRDSESEFPSTGDSGFLDKSSTSGISRSRIDSYVSFDDNRRFSTDMISDPEIMDFISQHVSPTGSPMSTDDDEVTMRNFPPQDKQAESKNPTNLNRQISQSTGNLPKEPSTVTDTQEASTLTKSQSLSDLRNFDLDTIKKKLLALKNIDYNRKIDIFQNVVNVKKTPGKQLPFWTYEGPLSKKEKHKVWNSVHTHMIRLPNIDNLLPQHMAPTDEVFAGMTKLEHILHMTGSMAHGIIGLSDANQIATLMSAVLSHIPDIEMIDDSDPTVIGIRDKTSTENKVLLHKFDIEHKRGPLSGVGTKVLPSISQPARKREMFHVKFYFDKVTNNPRMDYCLKEM